jgi:hypothetical protein
MRASADIHQNGARASGGYGVVHQTVEVDDLQVGKVSRHTGVENTNAR